MAKAKSNDVVQSEPEVKSEIRVVHMLGVAFNSSTNKWELLHSEVIPETEVVVKITKEEFSSRLGAAKRFKFKAVKLKIV